MRKARSYWPSNSPSHNPNLVRNPIRLRPNARLTTVTGANSTLWGVSPRSLRLVVAPPMTAIDPLLQVGCLGSDGGVVTVPRVDDGLRRQLQKLAADGIDDRREIRVRA
jgi:hypothetical protein